MYSDKKIVYVHIFLNFMSMMSYFLVKITCDL